VCSSDLTGLKRVYRIINKTSGKSEGDYITLEHEDPQNEKRIKMFHPVHTFISKFVTNFEARELQHTIFENGKRVYEIPSLQEIRDYLNENLELLWDEYKRNQMPEEYPVDLSQACWDNKMKRIEEVKLNIEEMIGKMNE